MRRETPQEWLTAMQHPSVNISSLRELARKAEVSPSAITRLVFGESTSDETVGRVADVLRIPTSRVWELHGKPRPKPFQLDHRADRLSPTQRAAVLAVVNAMLEDKGEVSGKVVNFPVAPPQRGAAAARKTKPRPKLSE